MRRLCVLVGGAALLVALSGCSLLNTPLFDTEHTHIAIPTELPTDLPTDLSTLLPPGDTPTPGSGAGPATDAKCANGVALLRESNSIISFTGSCGLLQIQGSNIQVTGQHIDRIIISGDGSRVTTGSVSTVVISGQNNRVASDAVGVLVISGDGNAVKAATRVTTVTVNGNTNTVTSVEKIGFVANHGTGNSIG